MTDVELFEGTKPGSASAITAEIHAALAARYERNEWVLVREATLGIGSRRADTIAVNLWPSRSHVVVGFEVKATRTDWLRELRKPSKANDFYERTHAWYLVTGPKVLGFNELPRGWGHLELVNGALVQRVAAQEREDVVLDHAFLANLLRRAREGAPEPGSDDLRAAYNRGHDDATKAAKKEQADLLRFDMQRAQKYEEEAQAFYQATGTPVNAWHGDLPAAARWVLQHGDPDTELRRSVERLRQAADQIERDLADPKRRIPGGKP